MAAAAQKLWSNRLISSSSTSCMSPTCPRLVPDEDMIGRRCRWVVVMARAREGKIRQRRPAVKIPPSGFSGLVWFGFYDVMSAFTCLNLLRIQLSN
ncbi:hypothetical protein V6N13_046915 [Hibiscus sabdariffa]